jgi:hypothetical protein
MDTNTIRYYFSKAKKAKEDVSSVYNEVLKFTDLTYEIVDSETKSLTINEIDSIIPTSLDDLVSFLMSSLISRSTKWATIQMNEKLYSLTNGDSDAFSSSGEVVTLNRQLEAIVDITYTYLGQSNYYTEVAKAMRECVNIGTGAYRVSETDDPIRPFMFQYLPLDDLFYWEDAFGRPTYIFKNLRAMNMVSLNLMFGEGKIKKPSSLTDENESTVSLLEVVYPSDNDSSKYMYEVYTPDLTEKLYSVELEYIPIVIFRWKKEGTNPNGLGLSLQGLKTFKELKSAKEKRDESADKLLKPPLTVDGDKALAMMLSLKAGAVNYTGTNTPIRTAGTMNQNLVVNPIQTVGTLLPLDQDIAKYENEIRQLYLSNPVGQINDYKRRSATESSIRLNALRQKYALSFDNLEKELLQPTLLIPLRILVKQRKLEFDTANLDITMINYKNALSLDQDMDNVERVNTYMDVSGKAMQMATPTGLKLDKVLRSFQKNLGISAEMAMSDDELQQLAEAQMAAQQQQGQMETNSQEAAMRQQEIDQDAQRLELRQAKQAASLGM